MPEKVPILYIEDNPNNQRLVQVVLEARGYRVLIARDGPEGLAQARTTTPALILVDIGIPGLDGYETTTRLRSLEHLRDTPIVALTADARAGTRERTLAAGCDGYITKPINARRLPDQIQEFIEGKREQLPEGAETLLLREYAKKLVERLERQVREVTAVNQELQELDRHKSQFLALLSHELRTPLTSILGFIELFERGTLGPLNNQQQQDAIGVISRNSHTLVRQLNNLLFLQEVRLSQLKPTPLRLDELLRRLLAEIQSHATDAHITLHAELAPVRPYNADLVAIEHGFRHLLDNAIKFTPAGGHVYVVLCDEPSSVVLWIKDTGIGIPASLHEKIFQAFYQVDSSLARPFPGVGIGLAIVKHVIEAHRGQVVVQSELGQGSTFTVILPR